MLPSVTSTKAAGLAWAMLYSSGFKKPRGLPFLARDSELRRPTRPAHGSEQGSGCAYGDDAAQVAW